MAARRDRTAAPVGRALVITRVFDAPRELVWKAWTEPDRLKRWWGPRNFTAPAIQVDLRVGGRYLYCMRSPDGRDYWSTGVYREIIPMKRIVATDSFADERGNVVPASHYGMPGDIPLEMRVTVTFEDHGGKTKLTLTHEGLPAGEHRDLAAAGWNESLDKLAESLAVVTLTVKRDELKVVMERTFDAPREAVFKAFVDPQAIPRWWGPRRLTTTVEKMDVRVGGAWRFVCRDDAGHEDAFHGVFKAIDPPKLLSLTFNYEGVPGDHELLETTTFEDLSGRTRVISTATYANLADLDGMVASGMETGATESWDRLAELLAS